MANCIADYTVSSSPPADGQLLGRREPDGRRYVRGHFRLGGHATRIRAADLGVMA